MEKKKIGFTGKSGIENSLEDFLGEWVVISLRGNGSYSGKLESISDADIFLFPYQNVVYEGGRAKYFVQNKGLPASHSKMDIVSYKQSSEKEILGLCDELNRNAYLTFLRREKEISDLENYLKNKK